MKPTLIVIAILNGIAVTCVCPFEALRARYLAQLCLWAMTRQICAGIRQYLVDKRACASI